MTWWGGSGNDGSAWILDGGVQVHNEIAVSEILECEMAECDMAKTAVIGKSIAILDVLRNSVGAVCCRNREDGFQPYRLVIVVLL